jgi:hypothetical protein
MGQASFIVLLLFLGNVYADAPLGTEQEVPFAIKEFKLFDKLLETWLLSELYGFIEAIGEPLTQLLPSLDLAI